MKIFLILILALILRLISLNQSLWLDEAITAVAIKSNGLIDLVTKFSVGDLHPPLHYVLLWFWGHLFGYSEISLRLPSVILGVATVWLVYQIGTLQFNKKVGLLAGLLLAVAPLHVYYSQEARMYSLAVLTVTLSFYFLIRMTQGKSWSLLGLLVANTLILFTDYVAYLAIPAQIIYVFMCPYMGQKEAKSNKGLEGLKQRYFSALLLSLSTLIFWEPVFLMQLSSGISTANTLTGWASVVGGAGFKELALIPIKTFMGRISFEDKSLYALITGFLSIGYSYVFWHAIRKFNQVIVLLILWIFVPIVLAFGISLFIPVLSYFRLIFILPAFYLLLALGLSNLPHKLFKPILFAVICVNLIFLGFYYTNPKFQREYWRGLVAWQKQANVKIVLESNDAFAPINYYEGSNFYPGLKKVPVKNMEEVFDVGDQNVYVLQYLVDVTDPGRLLERKLVKQGFQKKDTIDFTGVGFLNHYVR